jgi:hypothetical protein
MIRALRAKSKKLLPKPPTMPDADAQPPGRGSGTHSLNFRKTIREHFPAVSTDLRQKQKAVAQATGHAERRRSAPGSEDPVRTH